MRKWAARIGIVLALLLVAATALGWWLMRASLPRLDGHQTVTGLSAPVTVQRDARGTVTIDAANQADAVRALGYVHAQERYFEMDLMRRSAAGELVALVGPKAAGIDAQRRRHAMRERAQVAVAAMDAGQRAVLQAYADGVNQGLSDLQARPWAYLLLRQQPQPWLPVDSLLTGQAMYFDLQDPDSRRELALLRLRDHLPPALFALLTRDGTRWDAPLVGQPRGDAVLPGADAIDLRTLQPPPAAAPLPYAPTPTPGSNNFAVSGALTADGRAIVANDMHLMLRAPGIWFRARLRYTEPATPATRIDVQGFTLPGLPLVVVGSNGQVAWGFTNSYVGNLALQQVCGSVGAGCTDDSAARAHRHKNADKDTPASARMAADDAGTRADRLPVIARSVDGRDLAQQWSAYFPRALDLDLGRMADAASVDAVAAMPIGGIPAQNMVLADRGGAIGWILSGNLPAHGPAGCDPMHPSTAAQTSVSPGAAPSNTAGAISVTGCWLTSLPTPQNPRIVAPASGRLWTANARVLDGAELALVGDGGYDLGARAQQIRDDLQLKDRFNEHDLLAIQLDDRAVFLQRWWALLREQAKAAPGPAMHELANAAMHWEGRASAESVSYRIVRAWRLAVLSRILDGLTAPAQSALKGDYIQPKLPQFEGVAWPLVSQRPLHLLSLRYPDWNALFEDAARDVQSELGAHGPLAQRSWGERNTARICHPLAGAIPFAGEHWLCMPPDQQPGDANMPRVAAPRFGASQRMVVAPGHEQDGIIQMPGGQSGHPLSPFWGAGHDDWVRGRPTPFLPGHTRYTLTLHP